MTPSCKATSRLERSGGRWEGGQLTSRGGLQCSELWVCVTGLRDASSPHTDSALVWTDRWSSMKAIAFSLATHGHLPNPPENAKYYQGLGLIAPSLLSSHSIASVNRQSKPEPRHKPAEDATHLNLTKRGLGHNASRGEAIAQLRAT